MTRCLICGQPIHDMENAHEIELNGLTDGVKAYACQKCHDDTLRGAMPCQQPGRFTFHVH